MHLLECMFILEHCTALRWRVAHLGGGILFFRYRERARGRLVLETEVVKKAGLWLWLMIYTCIEMSNFNICIV